MYIGIVLLCMAGIELQPEMQNSKTCVLTNSPVIFANAERCYQGIQIYLSSPEFIMAQAKTNMAVARADCIDVRSKPQTDI